MSKTNKITKTLIKDYEKHKIYEIKDKCLDITYYQFDSDEHKFVSVNSVKEYLSFISEDKNKSN